MAHILVVDDEAAIRKLTSRFLTGAGHTCEFAESVAGGRRQLATQSFDLVLIDLKMPGESGLELIRYAKQHHPQVGRIVISGFGSPAITSEVLQIGVYGYLVKPITENELLITIENALQHLRLEQHMRARKKILKDRWPARSKKILYS